LVDEVNNGEELQESQPDNQVQSESEDLLQSKVTEVGVAELEGLVAQKDEELVKANTRIAELEQALTSKDGEISSIKQSREELEERFVNVSNSLAEAVAGYRNMLVQANPDVIEELITGETIEAINESLDKAKALVSRVRQGLETEISLARIPAGAPERIAPDFSALSPREKIQQAIATKR
jgi:chromosome segregation ATPase